MRASTVMRRDAKKAAKAALKDAQNGGDKAAIEEAERRWESLNRRPCVRGPKCFYADAGEPRKFTPPMSGSVSTHRHCSEVCAVMGMAERNGTGFDLAKMFPDLAPRSSRPRAERAVLECTCETANRGAPCAAHPRSPASRRPRSVETPSRDEADREYEEGTRRRGRGSSGVEGRKGPMRAITRVIDDRGGVTPSVRAELECGHERTVLRTAKRDRCRKCIPKTGEGKT
jgi:hypothetical protein